jgi:hypothetical protein
VALRDLRLRRENEPESVRLVIIAESPPASGKYFYDSTGFAALTRHLGLSPLAKEAGLRGVSRPLQAAAVRDNIASIERRTAASGGYDDNRDGREGTHASRPRNGDG